MTRREVSTLDAQEREQLQAIVDDLCRIVEHAFHKGSIDELERQILSIASVIGADVVQEDIFKIRLSPEYCSSESRILLRLFCKNVGDGVLAKVYIPTGIRSSIRERIPCRAKTVVQSIYTQPKLPSLPEEDCSNYTWISGYQSQNTNFRLLPRSARVMTDGGEPSSGNKRCVIYLRVSSRRQALKGHGLEGQLERCLQIVSDRGYHQVRDPIVEVNEKGTNLNRAGLNDLLETVREHSVNYVIVYHVDRIGRRVPQTLDMISELNYKYGTVVVTPTADIDTRTMEGMTLATISALISDLDNRNRGRRTQRGKVDGFLNKNWFSFYKIVPLGYNIMNPVTKGGKRRSWIQVSELESDIVQNIFRYFTNSNDFETYAGAIRHIQDEFGIYFSTPQFKTLLTNPVYIGKPRVRVEMDYGEVIEEIVHDESLKIIEDSTYEQAFSRLENMSKTREKINIWTLERVIDKFGIRATIEVLGTPLLGCSDENCPGSLRQDGLANLNESRTSPDETKVQRYECKKCGKKEKLLTEWKLRQLRNFDK